VGFNRGHFFSALAGLIVGALLIGALPGMAANGDNLVLGEKNTARRITKVTTKNGVLFRTTRAGTPAITLDVVPGTPPLQVNSSVKVSNLNADRVDGMHGSWLVRAAHASSDDIDESVVFANDTLTAADFLDVDITAPVDGTLLMWGSTDAGLFGISGDGDLFGCGLLVDTAGGAADQEVPGSIRNSLVSDTRLGDTSNRSENCATSGALDIAAGTHTIRFRITDRSTSVEGVAYFNDASLQVLFVPFDGGGKRINVP